MKKYLLKFYKSSRYAYIKTLALPEPFTNVFTNCDQRLTGQSELLAKWRHLWNTFLYLFCEVSHTTNSWHKKTQVRCAELEDIARWLSTAKFEWNSQQRERRQREQELGSEQSSVVVELRLCFKSHPTRPVTGILTRYLPSPPPLLLATSTYFKLNLTLTQY